MKQVKIAVYDDIEYRLNKRLIEAKRTLTIGLEGEWREIDLSESNLQAFSEAFGIYWAHSSPPGEVLQPAGTRNSAEHRSYFKEMRAWADAQGRGSEYEKHKSGFRHSVQLRRDYDAHLKAQAAS